MLGKHFARCAWRSCTLFTMPICVKWEKVAPSVNLSCDPVPNVFLSLLLLMQARVPAVWPIQAASCWYCLQPCTLALTIRAALVGIRWWERQTSPSEPITRKCSQPSLMLINFDNYHRLVFPRGKTDSAFCGLSLCACGSSAGPGELSESHGRHSAGLHNLRVALWAMGTRKIR